MKNSGILRIVAPYMVAGAVWEYSNGQWQCTQAPPIIRWMIGKSPEHVAKWLKRKNFKHQWIPDGIR